MNGNSRVMVRAGAKVAVRNSYLGSMEKKALTHEKSTGVTDCSQSGCHRPLGVRGTPYSSW
jgi:hypothetical protein